MEKTKTIEVSITSLKFSSEDVWLTQWAKDGGGLITNHPIYLALKGDRMPLHKWCTFRRDIWLMERLDLVMDVYKSLIRYGQLEPIIITRDNVIVSGHKRACCLLIMGHKTIKSVYENQ